MVITSGSASLAFSAIHASHGFRNTGSVVSQMPMKPRRLASSSEVSPEVHASPGTSDAG